jgi:catechol 2,3-dioxygenase-like lactoylglutathione lyase family enzyme
MLASQEIISFLATVQPEAAIRFYRDILGFTLVEDAPYALVFENGAGQMLRISKPPSHTPAPHTVLGWRVADIIAEAAALAARGVAFLRYGFLQQDEAGIWTSPSGDKVAWFADPDGNVLSLTQFVARA